MRRLIFGMGIVADAFLHTFNDIIPSVIGYVVSDGLSKPGKAVPVYYVSELKEVDFDEILLVNSHFETVQQVFAAGIDKNRIVLGYIGLMQDYLKTYGNLDVRVKLPAVLTNHILCPLDVYGDEVLNFDGNQVITNEDYCRRAAFRLVAREIKDHNVKGATAELGVYRGDFSKYINEEFPNRHLYLFDTFEGFEQKQTEKNVSAGYSSIYDISNSDFSNTSVELVMGKMKHPEMVRIRRGVFPETIPDEDVMYAFVSIDCDLYDPILDGIRYFYPSMNEGGYIFIHDYNNPKFAGGVQRAIRTYEQESGMRIRRVPLPDENGTVVIMK